MKKCETLERMLKLSAGDREKTGKVVARSFFKLLRHNGFSHSDVMEVAGNILDEVMKDMKARGKDRELPIDIHDPGVRPTSKEVA